MLEPGYADTLAALPAGSGPVLVLADRGARSWFDGTRVVLEDAGGTRDLLTFPSAVFGSFLVRVDADTLAFGENRNGTIWRVPLAGGATQVATLPFNYDAVPFLRGSLLVSAKVRGFGDPDNDVIAVDLTSGATDPIALLPGFSGPLVGDRLGGVFYATATGPGRVEVLHFTQAQLRSAIGSTHLTAADATVVARGLDSAGDLALDGDGDLFATDWHNARVVELSFGPGGGGRVSTLLAYDPNGATGQGLQLVERARGRGVFEPFQPGDAETLLVHETDFVNTSRLRSVAPVRAATTVEPAGRIGAGAFALVTRGAAPGGMALVAIAPPLAGREPALLLQGFEQPLFWDAAMAAAFNTYVVPIDATGQARLSLHNPGLGTRTSLGAQVAFVDAAGVVIGSAAAVTLLLE